MLDHKSLFHVWWTENDKCLLNPWPFNVLNEKKKIVKHSFQCDCENTGNCGSCGLTIARERPKKENKQFFLKSFDQK